MILCNRTCLIRWGLWLARQGGWVDLGPKREVVRLFACPPDANQYVDKAREFVLQVEPLDASGEAKRHEVYARLMKAFPEAKKKDLAMAIEWAVR